MIYEEWLACANVRSLRAELIFQGTGRKLRLFAAACLRRVWSLLDNEAQRMAVEVLERYADGQASREELLLVWTNAEYDTAAGLWQGPPSTLFSWYCSEREDAEWEDPREPPSVIREAERNPPWTAARAVFHARELVAWHSDPDERPEAVEQETLAQYVLLRDILGGPSGKSRLNPAWLAWDGATVPKVARALYDTRDFDHLPVLADALEEAGCDDDRILTHCRRPSAHARGCWVVDLILGM